jgi:hypothetical protein
MSHPTHPHPNRPPQYDTNQIYTQLGAPAKPSSPAEKAHADAFISLYGTLMRNSTLQVQERCAAGKKDGLFLPSCLEHGVANSTTIHGVTYMALVGDLFWERNTLDPVMVDNCTMTSGMPCNPTCTDHRAQR